MYAYVYVFVCIYLYIFAIIYFSIMFRVVTNDPGDPSSIPGPFIKILKNTASCLFI